MRLSDWIREQESTQAQIARQLGVSQPYLSMLASERRRPSIEMLDRIEAHTEGAVTLRDFINA
jgi:transcriptional regulator with XRE-family HTH domain